MAIKQLLFIIGSKRIVFLTGFMRAPEFMGLLTWKKEGMSLYIGKRIIKRLKAVTAEMKDVWPQNARAYLPHLYVKGYLAN